MIITTCMKSMNTIRLAIPKPVIEAMRLYRGCRIVWTVTAEGEAMLQNLDRLAAIGAAHARNPNPTGPTIPTSLLKTNQPADLTK